MNKEEKEAIERFKSKIKRADVDIIKFSDVYTTLDIHNLRVLLNLIQKQDKIIDKMAEQLAGLPLEYFILGDKEEVKEYFKKVVDKDVKEF